MASFGVNVGNRFDLLSDEPIASALKAAPAAAPAPAAQAPAKDSNKGPIPANEVPHHGGNNRGRGGRGRGRGGRGGRSGELGFHGQNDRAPAERSHERSDAAPRGERQHRPAGQTRQRERDGHTAGTGYQGRGAKRDGRGAYQFGSATDTTVPATEGEAAPAVDGEAAPAEEVAAPAAPVEEEDKTLTLDQYLKAQQDKLLAEDLNKNLRIAGEIEEDEREIRATKEFEAEDSDEEDILGLVVKPMKSTGHAKKHHKASENAPKKMSLDQFVGAAAPAPRGDFGFRGGRGGRGGRTAVNIADQSAFPSLGKK